MAVRRLTFRLYADEQKHSLEVGIVGAAVGGWAASCSALEQIEIHLHPIDACVLLVIRRMISQSPLPLMSEEHRTHKSSSPDEASRSPLARSSDHIERFAIVPNAPGR